MRKQHQTRAKAFYESSINENKGQIRILCEASGTIDGDNKRMLDDAVREMPNQRLKIEIRCKSIDDDSLCALKRFILLNESLQWMQLPQTDFTSYGLQQLCQCLERAMCLKTLILREAKLTDAALPSLIAMIEKNDGPSQALQRLQYDMRLQFPMCSFSEENWIQLFESLTHNKMCSSLQLLSAKLTDEVIPWICGFLRDNATLWQLRVQGLKNKGFIHLCQALRSNSTIRSISLGYGPYLSEEATSSLCDLLVKNTTLRGLSIEDNERKLTSDALQQLCEALQDNATMANIRLGGYMSDEIILQFVEMLKRNNTCTNIGIKSECTTEGLTEVWKALAVDKKIKRLNFQNVKLTDSAVRTVCLFIRCNSSVETFDVGQARFTAEGLGKVLSSLLENPNWQNLELRGAKVWDESVDHLCQLIQTNRTLQKLIINWSDLDATQFEQLCNLFSGNASMKEFWLEMKGLGSDTLEYVSSLLDTGLESFVSEETITDAEFNLIFNMIKDNPRIVEARMEPNEHQMIFKYKGIERAPGLGEEQHQHQSAEVGIMRGNDSYLPLYSHGYAMAHVPEDFPTAGVTTSPNVSPTPQTTEEDWSITTADWSLINAPSATTLSTTNPSDRSRALAAVDSVRIASGSYLDDSGSVRDEGADDAQTLPRLGMVQPHLDDQPVHSQYHPDMEKQPKVDIRQQHIPKPSTIGNFAPMAATAIPKMVVPEADDQSGMSSTEDQHAATSEHTAVTTAPTFVPSLDSLKQWAAGLEPPSSFAEYEEVQGETTSTCKMLGADTYQVKVVRTRVYRRLHATSSSGQEKN